jgi:hypothetical protein
VTKSTMPRIALIAMLLASPLVLAAPENISKTNGSISTQAGNEYGKLSTVNGSIRVSAAAMVRSAETVNGAITIDEDANVGKASTVNGSLTLERGATIETGASTVNGAIRLGQGSEIGGRVETVNGGIRLNAARVGGGIETVNGSIMIGENSHVRGGILVNKAPTSWFGFGRQTPPKVEIGANAVVEGELRFEREVELVVHPSARIGNIVGAAAADIRIERR